MMLNTYELGIYEKALPVALSWQEKFSAARKAGYDYFELSIDESEGRLKRLDWPLETRMDILRMSMEEGIPIRSMCLSAHRKYSLGSSNKESEKKALEISDKAIRLASDLGIRTVMLAGYDVYYEESTKDTEERFRNNLASVTERAASLGVVLAFETMETQFMNTVAKAMKYVNEIKSPYLQVYPDSGNVTNAWEGNVDEVKKDLLYGAGNCVSIHLKETAPGVFRDMMFGDGYVNFDELINTAWNMGIRRFVTEYWNHGETDWEERLKAISDFARSRIEKVEKRHRENA